MKLSSIPPPPEWSEGIGRGSLQIAAALAHVGSPAAPSLDGPWSALVPMRVHPAEQGPVSAVPVWCGAESPSAGWRGLWVRTQLEPEEWGDEWTTVCVAPALRIPYAVSAYTPAVGDALCVLTRDEWAGPCAEAEHEGVSPDDDGEVSSMEYASSSEEDGMDL